MTKQDDEQVINNEVGAKEEEIKSQEGGGGGEQETEAKNMEEPKAPVAPPPKEASSSTDESNKETSKAKAVPTKQEALEPAPVIAGKQRPSAKATTPGVVAVEPSAAASSTPMAAAVAAKTRTAGPATTPGVVAVEPGAPATTERAAAEAAKGALEPAAAVTTANVSGASPTEKPPRVLPPATEPGVVAGEAKHKMRAAEPPAGPGAETQAPPSPGGTEKGLAAADSSERNIRHKIQVQQKPSQPDVAPKEKAVYNKKDIVVEPKIVDRSVDLADKDTDLEKGGKDAEEQPSGVTAADAGIVQLPTFEPHTTAKDKEDEKDLAVAVPVNEEVGNLVSADIYQEEAKPFYKRTIFWVVVVALLAVAGLVIGLAVHFATDDDDSSDELVGPPTPSPTSFECYELVLELEGLVGPSLVASSPEAFRSAAHWLCKDPYTYTNVTVFVDPETGFSEGVETSETIVNLQRFALAWFWFHSTFDGTEPWLSCNPADASQGEDDTCQFLTVSVVELVGTDVIMCYAGIPSTRWLSPMHECEWPGVNCDDKTQTIAWEIDLLGVGIRGTFPVFLSIMPGIESIQLTYGAMTGQFPEDMNMFENLWQLAVIGNLLTDPFPESFFDLPIWILNLAYNQFTGKLPAELGKFPDAAALYLMENEFTGPLPDSLSQLQALLYLRLEANPLVGSTLPASWGNLASLEQLYLYDSELVGTIPPEWSNMTSMQDMRIYGNNLEGPLPNLAGWQDLLLLFVNQNRLNGTFPEEL